MTYVPTKVIRIINRKLVESTDLTVTLQSLLGQSAFLVVENNQTNTVLDLGMILTRERGLVMSSPVSSALSNRLTDLFVYSYTADYVPVANDRGIYEKALRVFSPLSYKTYKVQFTSINTPDILDDVVRKGYLDDLVITGPDDLSQSLVAVNGVFHRTVFADNKLYVLDGFRTCRISSRKDVTIVDTSRLGGHTVIPLTTANVSLTTKNGLATVSLPSSMKNKTPFLVIDGYFYHLDDDIMYPADDTHLKIRVNKLPLVKQFRHNPRTMRTKDRFGLDALQGSRKYTDAYDDMYLGTRQIQTDVLDSLEFQYSRLTHYHSFVVLVDTPALFPVTKEVLPTGAQQFYIDHTDDHLSGMISYGSGLCPSYLLFRDPFRRKMVWIQAQDYDLDIYEQTIDPMFIPNLIPEPIEGAYIPTRFIDYVGT